MSATITRSLKIDKAIRNIEDLDTGYYFFAGKPTSWDDESAPEEAGTSNDALQNVFDQMIFLKKCASSDAILCIHRFDWSSGTTYEKYKSSRTIRDLFELTRQSKSIYVMNDTGQVYICLDNNNSATSTTKPTGTSTSRFETGDGYIWKFLFDIDSSISSDFLTTHWIPVPYLAPQKTTNQDLVEAAVTAGTVDSLTIDNPGSNYDGSSTVVITGDGTGATADITVTNGEITDVTMTNVGVDYTQVVVTVVGVGSDAVLSAEVSPLYGHGFDIKKDLNANHVVFYGTFSAAESGEFLSVNDFRQIGIVHNPTDDSDVILTAAGYTACTTLTLSSITGGPFDYDEVITSSPSLDTGIIFSRPNIGVTDGDIQLISVNNTFTSSELIAGESSATTASIDSVTESTYKKYSGEIMYLENVKPVTRNTSQTEHFRFVIEY